MTTHLGSLRQRLREFDFASAMVEELGWNHLPGTPEPVEADGETYSLITVAEKAGMVVYLCEPGPDGRIPEYPTRQKIERWATKAHFEHLIVFIDSNRSEQVWQWVKRERGKPAAWRERRFIPHRLEEPLVQRLDGIRFALDEEENLNIAEVAGRVQRQLDVDRLTKRFYDRFKKEHGVFLEFIEGIADQGDREWYASVMLNRMMFIYFIQKKGFLDGDIHYLRNRLNMVQGNGRKGEFHRFYRMFLLRLFHEGLAVPEGHRDRELVDLIGNVPYLNGGLFDVHDIERGNPGIGIPDEAFEGIFDFFDSYSWHLDERPERNDNEINPDVLGYIFEKYINQKQMGAYYTKEDITGYISRNTIIPFLFDAARKECAIAFAPDGGVWRLLQEDPDRYIYPAVGHGIRWNARQDPPELLREPLELPPEIAVGLDEVSERGAWNTPAPDAYALPTEIWREVVARRERYQEVRDKLTNGEISDINELITLNLDIERFAQDAIVNSEGPELVRAFWKALQNVTVLDPTCGSGAFLFAALNVLEPLYSACLEAMQGFLDDLERSTREHHPDKLRPFRDALYQIEKHPSRRYFVLKSIVIINLYGVDIMKEAVEICKVRLFLKLVAQVETVDQIEPLPDIDFNIRAGNTLVGFSSIEAVQRAMTVASDGHYRMLDEEQRRVLDRVSEDAEIAARSFRIFQEMQSQHDMDAGEFTQAKAALRGRLNNLRDELDRYLAAEYGTSPDDSDEYDTWRATHQPFHWFVEFYGIMHQGGFDIIIGNPPWREYSVVKKQYEVRGYETEGCGNLYALCAERSTKLTSRRGWFSFIVQLPFLSSSRMVELRKLLLRHSGYLSYIPFDDRPGKLFDGLDHCRSVIFLSERSSVDSPTNVFAAKYQRWASNIRNYLFPRIELVEVRNISEHTVIFPKTASSLHASLLNKLKEYGEQSIGLYANARPTEEFIFYQESMQYWAKATYGLPYYCKNGIESAPAHGRYIFADSAELAHSISGSMNSSLFYIYFISYSDCFHLSNTLVRSFPTVASVLKDEDMVKLNRELMNDLHEKAEIMTINTRSGDSIIYEEFFAGGSKPVIDNLDRVLARHYGFTDEEVDFITNYDIKYRMSQNGRKWE